MKRLETIGRPVPQANADVAIEAAAEVIELAGVLLRELGATFPPCAEAVLRFRGPLLRFVALGELIDECVAQGDRVPPAGLRRLLEGVAEPGSAGPTAPDSTSAMRAGAEDAIALVERITELDATEFGIGDPEDQQGLGVYLKAADELHFAIETAFAAGEPRSVGFCIALVHELILRGDGTPTVNALTNPTLADVFEPADATTPKQKRARRSRRATRSERRS